MQTRRPRPPRSNRGFTYADAARAHQAGQGFSYAEVLLSVVLLAVLLVPAMQALQSGIAATPASAASPELTGLQAKLEEVLAAPFSKVYGETYLPGANTTTFASPAFSDAAGSPQRRVVVIYRYDVTTRLLAVTDTGLAYISVNYEAAPAGGLNTLVGRW